MPSELGILILDADLRVQSWNAWLERATSVTEAAIRGRAALDVVPFANRGLVEQVFAEVLERGTTRVLSPSLHHGIITCPPQQPSEYFTEMQQAVTIAPLHDKQGTVGIVLTVEDVTARMDSERAVLASARSDDWRTRAAATRSLKQSASRAQVAELLASFERDHQNFSFLSGALQVLASVTREVTGPLIELLHDDNPNIRMHAALALGGLADAAAVPHLVAALDDVDTNVCFHAIEALGRLRAADAVNALARVAERSDFFVAFPAIDALGQIDDAAVLPTLLSLLRREQLRPAIIDALGSLGDEDCVAALMALLDDDSVDATAVAAAIERIAARYERIFGAGDVIRGITRNCLTPHRIARLCAAAAGAGEGRAGAIVVAGWCGIAALDAVLSALGNAEFESQVTRAVLQIGPKALPALTARLNEPDRAVRLAAATLLGELGDQAATRPLIEMLSSHDAAVVQAAVASLTALSDPAALDSLVPLFAHPDFMVRQGALSAVQAIGDDRTRGRVREALVSDDPHVRESGVRVAGYFGFDDCVDGVVAALADPAEDVRRAAIEQLALMDDPRAEGLLVSALHMESARNRGAAAQALRWIDEPGVEPALIAALHDDAPWVRYFAAASLELRGSHLSVARLGELALGDSAPHVRIAAIKALSVIAPAVLAPMLSRLTDDHVDDVAVAGVLASGRILNPVAADVLARSVRSTNADVQMAAVVALGEQGTAAAVKLLEYAALLSQPHGLATAAMDALRRIAGSPQADASRAAILALVELGADARRRDYAVQLLGSLPSAAIELLAEALNSPPVETRLAAVDALARMRDPGASEALAAALADSDASVRSAVVAAFGRTGSSLCRDQLVRVSLSDPSLAVRRRAAIVCRRHGWTLDPRGEAP